MRAVYLAPLAFAVGLIASNVHAAETPRDIKGLYLMTDYPAVTVRPGTTSNIPLRLQNYGLGPERYQLSVTGVPSGWTATLLGGGQPVAAAMPAPDASVPLQLRLDVPAKTDMTAQTITIKADGQGTNQAALPINVALAKELPAKLTVDSKLPELRGSPKSNFEYTLTIKNDSGRNLTASFAAEAPANFETSFTEAYGTQELSSIPIDAGQSKDIKLKVRPPSTIDAGHFPVKVTVKAEDASANVNLALDVVGQPQLQVSGRDGLLSARAVASQQSSIPIVVTNTGTAPAENIALAATAPTGWKVTFEPSTIDRLVPGKDSEVQALVTPSDKSLAGDYMTSINATSRGESASGQFRITVATSTVWGMAGAGVIGVALLLMLGAVARFGRR
ncbi:COG1470 family protein [Bradyrhizobium canariense]|uniref:NPCBM-associated, NEW3 domain of alpha-galactosidase n=1 Tax=Bradyrhizobium canariense TaxID=255045 RepID=A0A1H2BSX5_9BRAD|nr:NEW3 domain-containing protein [Bradyrhizobium canariense]SDT61224.1 NPCBM-associated, NEW3 domain of alpha-galactosidase [Bradyrhizobium canariense]